MAYYHHLKTYFSNRSFLHSIFIAFVLFSLGLVMNYYAGTYAVEKESGSVTDIILSNTHTYDVDGIFVVGSFAMVAFILFLSFRKLNTLPFIGESIALFVMIRSVFITLTHIGPFPTRISIDSDMLSRVSFGGDLFFSGHTGLPFLMALIFWKIPSLRYTFLTISVFFAVIVLLGHLHYSIDVVSAYFITYSIFHIAQRLFKKDHHLFIEGISEY
jgi:hypothetical protein